MPLSEHGFPLITSINLFKLDAEKTCAFRRFFHFIWCQPIVDKVLILDNGNLPIPLHSRHRACSSNLIASVRKGGMKKILLFCTLILLVLYIHMHFG